MKPYKIDPNPSKWTLRLHTLLGFLLAWGIYGLVIVGGSFGEKINKKPSPQKHTKSQEP